MKANLLTLVEYGIANDGAHLHWRVMAPTDGKKRPAVLLLPGGGFRNLYGIPSIVATDLFAAGYIVFTNTEYRTAPPNKLIGQTSDGRFPCQTDDVTVAATAARLHKLCDGEVFAVGGSAGGSHAAYLASNGKVNAAVCFSPAMQFDDPISLEQGTFSNDVNNYAPDNLAAASPNNMLKVDEPAISIMSFQQDHMPAPQYTLAVAQLASLGAKYSSSLLSGSGHSWDAWRVPGVPEQVISFLAAVRSSTVTKPHE